MGGADDAAGFHRRLAGAEAALAVLVVDERQRAGVGGGGFLAAAVAVGVHHGLQKVRQQRARHGAGGAGVEVGHEGDRLLAVERSLYGVAARPDERAQLRRGLRRLDLETGDPADLPREPGEERDAQLHARKRRILHHDRQAGLRRPRELLVSLRLGAPEPGPVIGRHQHDHRGAQLGRPAAALDHDPGREMRGRDDDRQAARDMLQAGPGQGLALPVGNQELLGIVGEDAEPVRALVHHAVEHPPLPFEVEVSALGEDGRDDRPHAAPGSCHAVPSRSPHAAPRQLTRFPPDPVRALSLREPL